MVKYTDGAVQFKVGQRGVDYPGVIEIPKSWREPSLQTKWVVLLRED